MSKYRIWELAKEYNTSSKVILDILERNKIEANNHMSNVDENAEKQDNARGNFWVVLVAIKEKRYRKEY